MAKSIKAGDVVRRTMPGGKFPTGHQFEVKSLVGDEDDYHFGFAVDAQGSKHNPAYLKVIRSAWEPKQEEEIEVANSPDATTWAIRPFLTMHKGLFVCRTCDQQYFGYKYARPIKTHYTITLENGKEVKISKESYESLCLAARAQEPKT